MTYCTVPECTDELLTPTVYEFVLTSDFIAIALPLPTMLYTLGLRANTSLGLLADPSVGISSSRPPAFTTTFDYF